jgi:hypothetical protein
MSAPVDVQTRNLAGKAGKAEKNDTVTFTFATTVDPALILAGWSGAPTGVSVHFEKNGKNDLLSVHNASTDAVLFELGLVELKGDYTASSLDFTSSQMSASGKVVTIVLGNPSGKTKHTAKSAAMVWWTTKGSATESGAADPEF